MYLFQSQPELSSTSQVTKSPDIVVPAMIDLEIFTLILSPLEDSPATVSMSQYTCVVVACIQDCHGNHDNSLRQKAQGHQVSLCILHLCYVHYPKLL